jgi:hypothetical protein
VRPPGTLPRPTCGGRTVPVCEEARLGSFSVLPQDWGEAGTGPLRFQLAGQRARADIPAGMGSTAAGTLTTPSPHAPFGKGAIVGSRNPWHKGLRLK